MVGSSVASVREGVSWSLRGGRGSGRYVPPERGTVGVGNAALMQSAVMS